MARDQDTTPTPDSSWTVREGTPVITFDGEKIGEVENATGDYLLIRKGFLFPKEYSIPATAIANVGPDAVYLTVTKEAALAQGWDAPLAAEATTPARVVTGEPDVDPPAPLIGTFSDDRAGTYTDEAAGTETIDPHEARRDRSEAILDRATATAPAGIGADAEEIPANPIATGAVPPDPEVLMPESNRTNERAAASAEHGEAMAEGVDPHHVLRHADPLPAMDAPRDTPAPVEGQTDGSGAGGDIATDAALENEAIDPLIGEDAAEDPDPELPTPTGPARPA